MDIKANLPGASHAHHVEIPCIVFFALTPIFVIMRIWSRLSKGSKLGADDWTIVVSFVSETLPRTRISTSLYIQAKRNYGGM